MTFSPVAVHPQDGWFASVVPDLTNSEMHTKSSTLTKNPVEDGSTITDHILRSSGRFECDIYITNTPSEPTPQDGGAFLPVALQIPLMPPTLARFAQPVPPRPTTALVFQIPQAVDRIKRAWMQLDNLRLGGFLVDVVTSRFLYEGYVIVEVSETVAVQGGAQIHVVFEELRTVRTETVNAPKPAEPRGAPTSAKGAQAPIGPDQSDAAKGFFDKLRSPDASAAANLLEGVFGIKL